MTAQHQRYASHQKIEADPPFVQHQDISRQAADCQQKSGSIVDIFRTRCSGYEQYHQRGEHPNNGNPCPCKTKPAKAKLLSRHGAELYEKQRREKQNHWISKDADGYGNNIQQIHSPQHTPLLNECADQRESEENSGGNAAAGNDPPALRALPEKIIHQRRRAKRQYRTQKRWQKTSPKNRGRKIQNIQQCEASSGFIVKP